MKLNSKTIAEAGNAWSVGVNYHLRTIKIDFMKSMIQRNLKSLESSEHPFVIIGIAKTYIDACKIKHCFESDRIRLKTL